MKRLFEVTLLALLIGCVMPTGVILANNCGTIVYLEDTASGSGGNPPSDPGDDDPTVGSPDGNIKRVEVSLANQNSYYHSRNGSIGQKFDIEVNATNKGDLAISGAEIEYYLSDNLTFNESMDTRLGQDTGINIAVGGSITKHLQDVVVPQPGTYYIFCKIEVPGDHNSSNDYSRNDDAEEYAVVTIVAPPPPTSPSFKSDGFSLDYDGDGAADFLVWRPLNGTWWLRSTLGYSYPAITWGMSGDYPVPGHYDLDGIPELAVWRPSTGSWYIRKVFSTAWQSFVWGNNGDRAVPCDVSGDGVRELVVWRPSTGTWYIKNIRTAAEYIIPWGVPGDIPVPADYDGDGLAELCVFRPSEGKWYIRKVFSADYWIVQWGVNGDIPLTYDINGDGAAETIVWRPSNGNWYIRLNPYLSEPIQWGIAGDVPRIGDYDGDAIPEISVWRQTEGVWYIRELDLPHFTIYEWGVPGDIPQ